MKKLVFLSAFAALSSVAFADFEFNAGADLRVRQEFVKNAPRAYPMSIYKPGNAKTTAYYNHMRYRPDVWAEVKFDHYRLFTKLTDEFRWNIQSPGAKNNSNTFPDEVVIDNLFLEGTGLFDDKVDFRVGRQDLLMLYGLNHIFIDGTPGDGSRSTYTDMARMTYHVDEVSQLDVFALVNFDRNPLRWGKKHEENTKSMTGLYKGACREMDDFGAGVVWSSRVDAVKYQLFAMTKGTHSFHTGKGAARVTHPWTQRALLGAKIVPQLTDEISLQFEGMGQVGMNGDHDTLSGWSTYAGINWKEASESQIKPFASLGYMIMSGDKDAVGEDGGHHAWDPMWARGATDSEMMLYGTHYGTGWWSNLHFLCLKAGLDLGRRHSISGKIGPMFADKQDHVGGGDSLYKGLDGDITYSFPILIPEKGERLEIFGHVKAEGFQPGDYYASDKLGWYVRWQLDFRF